MKKCLFIFSLLIFSCKEKSTEQKIIELKLNYYKSRVNQLNFIIGSPHNTLEEDITILYSIDSYKDSVKIYEEKLNKMKYE